MFRDLQKIPVVSSFIAPSIESVDVDTDMKTKLLENDIVDQMSEKNFDRAGSLMDTTQKAVPCANYSHSWRFEDGSPSPRDSEGSDEEVKKFYEYLKFDEEVSISDEDMDSSNRPASWRALQTSGMQDYYPPDAFLMVSQQNWENDVIWDSEDVNLKNSSKYLSCCTVQNNSCSKAHVFNCMPPLPNSGLKEIKNGSAALYGRVNVESDGNFCVENSELVSGNWVNDIIWDVDEVDKDKVTEPQMLTFDPNDDNLVLYKFDDIDPNGTAKVGSKMQTSRSCASYVKKSKNLLNKAGLIDVDEYVEYDDEYDEDESPLSSHKKRCKDPYNISNDEHYQLKLVPQSSGGLQHSIPVIDFQSPFIPNRLEPHILKQFHRPALSGFSPGPHIVLSLVEHIEEKAKKRKSESGAGGCIFFMRTPEDLTGKDGEILLVEYSEEYPPLLSLVGMCSKIKNYYKRKSPEDDSVPQLKYGETEFTTKSPFLGGIHPGQTIAALENNMYRAPIYSHPIPITDFLIIRDRNNYYIRELDALYTAGQECPKIQVPQPNSKNVKSFIQDFLKVFIYQRLRKSCEVPRRIHMDVVKYAFPRLTEPGIRKVLNLCAYYKRMGVEKNLWVIKPEFRLPSEEEIRAILSPEQCCAYISLVTAKQRLLDAGYGKKLFANEDDYQEGCNGKIDDEIKTAPWHTTQAYIQAVKGKCLLQLTGFADPTGCGEGFSYVHAPFKHQSNKEGLEAIPKQVVTGTDADLRRLSLQNAKALLYKFRVPEREIKKLTRWEIIDVVRTLWTEKRMAGEKNMTRFFRGNQFSAAAHQKRYKEECQRIFDLQNRVLSSSDLLSSDEGESDEDDLPSPSIEEMGKDVETLLNNIKTSQQLIWEKEEQERIELQKIILGQGIKEDDNPKNDKNQNDAADYTKCNERILKIQRTYKNPDGQDYTRTEIIRNPVVIDAYTKLLQTTDKKAIARLLPDKHFQFKKEKLRLQAKLRSMKNPVPKKVKFRSVPVRKLKPVKPILRLKCGSCGQVGHMRTNTTCSFYKVRRSILNLNSMSPSRIGMTHKKRRDGEVINPVFPKDEELIKVEVEGTKLQITGMSRMPVEETKGSPSLIVKIRKDLIEKYSDHPVNKKRTRQATRSNFPCKKIRLTNRQRIDPSVSLNSIFESVLNELRIMPNVVPFLLPVNPKIVPNYYGIIKNPMHLQAMREKTKNNRYHLRSEFLDDVQLIRDNCSLFNGEAAEITRFADKLLEKCKREINEHAQEMEKLERLINPLLADDQTGLNFLLENCITRLKLMPDAHPFERRVSKKFVPKYYSVIRNPMELETMLLKVKYNSYTSVEEFMADLDLIYSNAKTFNGESSLFAKQALNMINSAAQFLNPFEDQTTLLERNIQTSQGKAVVSVKCEPESFADDEISTNNEATPVELHNILSQEDLKDTRSNDLISLDSLKQEDNLDLDCARNVEHLAAANNLQVVWKPNAPQNVSDDLALSDSDAEDDDKQKPN